MFQKNSVFQHFSNSFPKEHYQIKIKKKFHHQMEISEKLLCITTS